ncbi:hypothetical protein RBSWK_04571 [Rhodopirellula baltica SWK14]|uniref:Uncharacterized protein n=1 Tax=Rhodopirellula baltica SWK14 TaxID=993516 RepID=L7CC34_RHOBT|nr:hypothetical protein RBSWK_04571 [Rhodopirellula baltica SWK14]
MWGLKDDLDTSQVACRNRCEDPKQKLFTHIQNNTEPAMTTNLIFWPVTHIGTPNLAVPDAVARP